MYQQCKVMHRNYWIWEQQMEWERSISLLTGQHTRLVGRNRGEAQRRTENAQIVGSATGSLGLALASAVMDPAMAMETLEQEGTAGHIVSRVPAMRSHKAARMFLFAVPQRCSLKQVGGAKTCGAG